MSMSNVIENEGIVPSVPVHVSIIQMDEVFESTPDKVEDVEIEEDEDTKSMDEDTLTKPTLLEDDLTTKFDGWRGRWELGFMDLKDLLPLLARAHEMLLRAFTLIMEKQEVQAKELLKDTKSEEDVED